MRSADADASYDGVDGAAAGCGTAPAEDGAASAAGADCAGTCAVGSRVRQTAGGMHVARFMLAVGRQRCTAAVRVGKQHGRETHVSGSRKQSVGSRAGVVQEWRAPERLPRQREQQPGKRRRGTPRASAQASPC